MADDDKEKAEKLAAARKRVEQLKKKNAKKGTKKAKKDADAENDVKAEADEEDGGDDGKEDEAGDSSKKDGDDDTATARLDELDTENKRLRNDIAERESELAELRNKTAKAESTQKELDRLKADHEALMRENSQLQSSAQRRRSSAANQAPPNETLKSELAAKTSALEALELELSVTKTRLTDSKASTSDFEAKLAAAESTKAATEKRLEELRSSLSSNATATKDGSDAEDTQKRITLLTSDLSSARDATAAAESRASLLDKKIETLQSLHKDAEARHASSTKARVTELDAARGEVASLQKRLAVATTPPSRSTGAGLEVEDLEDEERNALAAKLRALEAENFELRRGVWREQRRAMQPGPDGEASFDDVDLSSPGAQSAHSNAPGFGFGNFLSQLTGEGAADQGADVDDGDFDEGAFAAAQADQAKARLERVRDIKRGLGAWKGWRMDIVDVRGGAMAGVFDV